ncbi:hypothetical protein KQR54_18855 [Mycobacterium gordonae]|nr:hypothetical protein [Mycobacterium gordonae]
MDLIKLGLEEELGRYCEADRRTIAEYWDAILLTRKSGKVSKGVVKSQLAYWSKYPADIVIEALRLHIRKYIGHPEDYTRGIIRNAYKAGEAKRAAAGRGIGTIGSSSAKRGQFGQTDRYIGEDDELPF